MNVSVLMSVYNEPIPLLNKAIDSILNQSYKDFEFIVILDKPDNVVAKTFLEGKSEQDTRIKIHVNPQNIGLTKSLNIGLSLCSGKYIARMDADDYSMPLRLEKQVSFLESHSEIVACSSFYECIDDNDRKIRSERLPVRHDEIMNNLLFQTPFCHPATMFRRIVDGSLVQYDETIKYSQDYALWTELCKKHKLANIPESLFRYRVSEQQITRKNKTEQQQYHIEIQKRIIQRMNILISETDENIVLNLLNQKEHSFTDNEIEDAIVAFVYNNANNENLSKSHNKQVFLLNYANYLPLYYPLHKAFYRLMVLAFRLRYVPFRAIASLVNKYR